MHLIIYYIAITWTIILLGVTAVMIFRADSITARILAFDTMALILVALLALFALANRSTYYLDAALILALLSFVETLAAAQYHSRRRVFS